MAKKQELKAMLAKEPINQKSSKVLEKTIKKSTERMEDKSMEEAPKNTRDKQKLPEKAEEITTAEKVEQISENPVMVEYKLSEADEAKVGELEQTDKYLVTILNVFTSNGKKETTTFDKGDTIQFHITCAVAKIFSQFSADFRVDTISQDLSNLLPQRIYGFSFESKLKYPYFEIVFESKAVLEGIFKYQIILTFGNVEYFSVHDSFIYRVI